MEPRRVSAPVIKSASILVLSGLAAFAVAAGALAEGPALSVSATTSAFSASGSTVVRFADTGQDPTSSIDLFAPAGYAVELNQPIGSTIGAVDARVATATAPDLRVAGLLKNADPLTFSAAAATCTPDRTAHDAVWTANLNSGGTAVGRLTLFVDRSTPSQVADFSARVRACLEDPAASGYRLTRAMLTLNGVFANPSTSGEYRWTTIMRTLSEPPGLPSESQTIVNLPPRLTLARKLIRPHGRRGRTFIRLSGRVTENGRGVSGVRVEVLGGTRPSSIARLTYATSFEQGRFAVVAPLKGNRFFRARVSAPLRTGPLSRCETFGLQPDAICSSLTLAPFTAQSPSVRLAPR
jgi:hypothetical protein